MASLAISQHGKPAFSCILARAQSWTHHHVPSAAAWQVTLVAVPHDSSQIVSGRASVRQAPHIILAAYFRHRAMPSDLSASKPGTRLIV